MDLRQLRYFLEMVEQGSLSQAARQLNVAQSALSFHLRNIEDELGTHLLVRQRSGVVATEAGEALARHARRLLDEHTRGLDEIRGMGREPVGTVRLGLPGTISDKLTVELIKTARTRFPKIRLTVSEAMSGFVAGWLRDEQIDLAILYIDPKEPDLRAQCLIDEELVVISAGGKGGTGCTSFTALQDNKLILPSPAHGLRQMLVAAAGRAGHVIRAEIEIDSYKNIKSLVGLGLGMSILPLHAVEAERMAGQLTIRRFQEPGLWRSLHLVHRTTRPPTRAVQAIAALIDEMIMTIVANGDWPGARPASSTRAGGV